MPRIDKHPRARRDLIEIWFYTRDKWGEDQADRYLRRIDDAIKRLAGAPGLGSDYGQVRQGVRRYPVERHRIFYRRIDRGIEIVRVLHPSMDIHTQLSANED